MYGNLKIIDIEKYSQQIDDFICGKTEFLQFKDEHLIISQKYVAPLDGYEPPKNFPYCCENHKDLLKIAHERFAKFPDCCEQHARLKGTSWFKKEDYSYIPLKILDTLMYTHHCIIKCIDNENWFKEITDYIHITATSFGQLPTGFGSPVAIEMYLENLEMAIREEFNGKFKIPRNKRSHLIKYLRNWGRPTGEANEVDLNLLVDTYQKWVNDFPFEIPFLSHLKEQFLQQLPILSGDAIDNLYSDVVGYKLKTYKELIDFLVKTTEQIITEVNTLTLYENGLIDDVQKTNIDIINASHRFNLKGIRDTYTQEQSQYINVIKKWFAFEKEYLNELTTALTKVIVTKKVVESKPKVIVPESPVVALFCYFVNDSQLLVRGENESITTYCKKVCKLYKLTYKDRVRQGFSVSKNKRNIHFVKTQILPAIEEKSKAYLLKYLDTKHPVKQNLYD